MDFQMNGEENRRSKEWTEKHKKECRLKIKSATSGRFTYSFTPIGLGCIVKVSCACGSSMDVTDSSNW